MSTPVRVLAFLASVGRGYAARIALPTVGSFGILSAVREA